MTLHTLMVVTRYLSFKGSTSGGPMRLMSCEQRGAQRSIDSADMIYGGGEAAKSPPRHNEKLAEPVFINRFEFHLRPLEVPLSGAPGVG